MGRLKRQVDYDLVGANASLQQAITLQQGNSEHLRVAAFSAACLGRFDQALQLGRRAIDLDPLNAGSWETLAETEFFIGQLDQSAADCKKALELNPDVPPRWIQLSRIYLRRGGRRMVCLKSSEYNGFPTVRFCIRLRTTPLVGKMSRTPQCGS